MGTISAGRTERLLTLCSVCLLSACVAVPYPTGEERLDREDILAVEVGQTTRTEFVRKFGEPNIFDGRNAAVYHLNTASVGMVFIVSSGVTGGGAAGKLQPTDLRLLVEFSPTNTVQRLVYSQIDNGKLENGDISAKGQHQPSEPPTNFVREGEFIPCEPGTTVFHNCHVLAVSRTGEYATGGTAGQKALQVNVFNEDMERTRTYLLEQEKQRFLSVQSPSIRELVLLPDTNFLFAAATKNQIQVFDASGFQPVHVLSASQEAECVSSMASAGQLLAGGTCRGEVVLWNYRSSEVEHTLLLSDDEISSLAFSPDGDLLAVYGGNGEIIIVNVRSLETFSLTGGSKHIDTKGGVQFSPDGEYLIANSCVHVATWETDSIRRVFSNVAKRWVNPKAVILNHYWDSNERFPEDRFNSKHPAPAAALSYKYSPHCGGRPHLTISGNGRVIAARSSKQFISFYDTEDAELVTVLASQPDSLITGFVFNPTNNTLVLLVARGVPSDYNFFALQRARSAGELWRGKDGSEIENMLMAR